MSGPDVHALRLSGGPESPGVARDALGRWLRGRIDADRLHDARLLVSELVTNGVRHAPAGSLHLAVRLQGDRLRIEVADAGGRFTPPPVVDPPPGAIGGRGLVIVDRVATAWGVSHDGRNTVWFEL